MGAVMVQYDRRCSSSRNSAWASLDIIGCRIQFVALISLSHKDGLVLEFRFLQLGTAVYNLVLQGSVAQAGYELALLDILASLLNGKHDDLFSETAIDRNLT